jgi:hypothetical protein
LLVVQYELRADRKVQQGSIGAWNIVLHSGTFDGKLVGKGSASSLVEIERAIKSEALAFSFS